MLEVDGMQHFTRNGGAEPAGAKYAATMAGDRDLKFRGYEVSASATTNCAKVSAHGRWSLTSSASS
ncbi:hypothetical protein [Streptomyces griseocarneus]|uniref:hypothetical protein n=1 Tax=Streptomyces griseocarneus TaxID=51201 RepID=UPI00167DECF4|nr:hypothetical protein [Streptomyces griseocarneus]MBZ6476487.1 hypothetical protein [Streptomyces griseocarneus]